MAKRTYSIRKGFEYQDYFCAIKLLELIEGRDFAAEFIIESNEVHHVDDIQLFPSSGQLVACQVKFHVDRSHQESFRSLTESATDRSRSVLQKLYRGWTELTNDGELSSQIEFVSSSSVDSSRDGLGTAIDTESDRIGDRFFTEPAFNRARDEWAQHLSGSSD